MSSQSSPFVMYETPTVIFGNGSLGGDICDRDGDVSLRTIDLSSVVSFVLDLDELVKSRIRPGTTTTLRFQCPPVVFNFESSVHHERRFVVRCHKKKCFPPSVIDWSCMYFPTSLLVIMHVSSKLMKILKRQSID